MYMFMVAQMSENLLAVWGDPGLIPGSGKIPEGGSSPLQYSCLGIRTESLADSGVAKESDTTEQLDHVI